MNTDARFNCGN